MSDISSLKQIDLSDAISALRALLPSASLTPDSISSAAEAQGIAIRFVVLPRWSEQEAGEDVYTKADIFDLMFSGNEIPCSEMFFIPDSAFSRGKAFCCPGSVMRKELLNFPEFIFDLDAIFLWPDAKQVSVFHHEGGYFHVQLSSGA